MEKQFWLHLKVHSPSCREKHERFVSKMSREKEKIGEGRNDAKAVAEGAAGIGVAEKIGSGRRVVVEKMGL